MSIISEYNHYGESIWEGIGIILGLPLFWALIAALEYGLEGFIDMFIIGVSGMFLLFGFIGLCNYRTPKQRQKDVEDAWDYLRRMRNEKD